ncbi:MAG: S-adenosylmethionine decarboxylase proenzyme [Thermotogae bacterium]|uniref:adenosylmethionine decarboxylase n=1 Tax=Kosmotoga sp. TaxID=1955248 RepID=UPI000F1C2015|nr:adenosylmethionine decarboxylase [Kosmotoga sp.]MBO8166129.1 S-adenosylmethionine decarboxylase proenzyme [Kosmotoga sp.]MCD6159368.1 S-adenosylmethionine decarboxylase proenzyme [Kosmotoga sp.]RKX49871.1 MAG: S-adenosylmethionine decarboxylase proenzyme [Thermotogota bacterium]
MKKVRALGRHLVAEFYECSPETLDDLDHVVKSMREAAEVAGATIVDSSFHRFLPHGISGVVVIAESHLTIHTWPEYGYAAVDLFTCGDEVNPWKAFEYLRIKLEAERTDVSEHLRGIYSEVGIPDNAPHKIEQ